MNTEAATSNPVTALIQCALCIFLMFSGSAWASGWDARTRLTNTVINDQDVKIALNQGLSQQFQQTFPSNHYGVYVLVDKSNASSSTRGVVYIMLGLSKRRPDGSYDLPEMTYSSMLPLHNDDPQNERRQITARLTEQAAVFAGATMQNVNRLR